MLPCSSVKWSEPP